MLSNTDRYAHAARLKQVGWRLVAGLGIALMVSNFAHAQEANKPDAAPAETEAAAAPGEASEGEKVLDPKARIAIQYEHFDKLVASGLTVEPLREKIKERMGSFVDFKEFSRLTVKEQWGSWDEARRLEYISLFKQLIERTYAKKFKPDNKLTVTFRGDAELRKGKARIQTTIASGDIEADVEYRLHQPAGKTGWWVYDIVIDDVSLMRNYRSQFQRIVKADSESALFAKLKEKVESGQE